MTTSIYLDNSATTPLSDAAKQAMIGALDCYGNPSSLHSVGQDAERLLTKAREQVLAGLGLRPRQKDGILVFTGSGTEATALALMGTAYAKKRREATRILTTDSEHPSVGRVMDRLAEDGFEIVRIPTKNGVPDKNALEKALDKPIFLASFMLVNNETGAIYPVGEMLRAVKAKYPNAITHCDAVQGFMKLPFTPATLSADLITVSAHKVHAPKGVGALYIDAKLIKAKKIVPVLTGGGQEGGIRSASSRSARQSRSFVLRKARSRNTQKSFAPMPMKSSHRSIFASTDLRRKHSPTLSISRSPISKVKRCSTRCLPTASSFPAVRRARHIRTTRAKVSSRLV